MAGVIAGIGSLLFTAIATYYGAAVSQDQLEQSREDAARDSRDQASRVAAWAELDSKGDFAVHLRNRSQDPVESVRMHFWVHIESRQGYGHSTVVLFQQPMSVIGPCTDLIVDEKSLLYTKTFLGRTHKLPDNAGVELKSVQFIDREGLRWVRASGSGLDQVKPGSREGWMRPTAPGAKQLEGLIDGEPVFKRAPGCGGDGG
ncbi:hypothetical protein [Streptomyces sp. NPDC051214]|uniref:hypothetical protein n=1 Tax=Streptomyces sp. NPDC051214 TaxID=3155282 RepID=UPI0034458E9B